MAAPRPPITCHILDTYTGKPAPDVPISLSLISPSASSGIISYSGQTNNDGRVPSWTAKSGAPFTTTESLHDLFTKTKGEMLWSIRFETRKYWEEKSITPFFPEVEIRFLTEGFEGKTGEEDHWHVPLLMTPFTYTTYRGS